MRSRAGRQGTWNRRGLGQAGSLVRRLGRSALALSLLVGQMLAVGPAAARQVGEEPGAATVPAISAPVSQQPGAEDRARLAHSFGTLPLSFVENQGQLDPRVAYAVQGRDTAIYFTPQGLTFALSGPDPSQAESEVPRERALGPRARTALPEQGARRQHWAVALDFLDTNPEVQPQGIEPTSAVVSYFTGPEDQWRTGLPTYGGLVYSELWPGIDLVYAGTVNRLKYTFVVQPGADPSQIRLAYRGATSVSLTEAGELEVTTPVSSFRDEVPTAYQEVDGQRVAVAAAYRLDEAGETEAGLGGQVYGFQVGTYDASRPLVIDPAVLVYAGYIGGADEDEGRGIAVDQAGNAYVTGNTNSDQASFPVKVGPDLTFNDISGSFDAFVAKVKADGTGLVYAGYIGGANDDEGLGIAVDPAGNAYVTGLTASDQTSFPVTVGPDLTFNGFVDAFVAKVRVDGTGLVYAGYIGGAGLEQAFGIAVDQAGNAYVTGNTNSDQASFPVKVGPDLTFNGSNDAFVAKVKADGTGLVYAGYIGGANDDEGLGIAVDAAGNAYVTGRTDSDQTSFPVEVGPDLTLNDNPDFGLGSGDAFVAKIATPAVQDTTSPSCRLTAGIAGPPAQLKITAQDTGSGLRQITILASTNATVSGTTGFRQGTTSPVVVTATKLDQAHGASVTLSVTDVAGNITVCDPVLTTLTLTRGGSVRQTFSGIPQAEQFVTIQNGDPGLKRLEVEVNGQRFRLDRLRAQEERTLDIGSALTSGSNIVTLIGQGERGASALVTIADTDVAATAGEDRGDRHGHAPPLVRSLELSGPPAGWGWGHLVEQHEDAAADAR